MKSLLKFNNILALAMLSILLTPAYAFARDNILKFAVIPQGIGNDFFHEVKAGCEQAASDLGGVQCLYGGPEEADVRAQSQHINQLIAQGVDGIAVSVINSDHLAKNTGLKAQKNKIPLITFNSDFDEKTQSTYNNIRQSYIGTNNFKFGWELGKLTRQLRPEGGKVCLISGHKSSPALQNRIDGVRAALAGISDPSVTITTLEGQNGWSEYSRCPFYSNDLSQRALTQLLHVFKKNEIDPLAVDTVIAVGAWPQQDEEAYREAIVPYKETLKSQKIIVVIGDAMTQQVRLLKENLAHTNIGQNPYQMGYQAITLLNRLAQGQPVPRIIYTPMIQCLPDREPVCREQK